MHNRIKALIVAAMVFTNTVSPTLEVLANEIEIEKASENIANTVSIEEETEENLALDIDESENADKEENTDEKSEESLLLDEANLSDKTNLSEQNDNSATKKVNKLEVTSNQGSFEWGYGDSNEISILVEFDNMNKKKVVEIELEEGMAFDKYPVVGSTSNEIEYEGTNEDKAIISKVLERPDKDLITNQYSGKLSYEINSTATVANIVVRASVDRYKYYGPKEIANAIKVTVKEDGIEQASESINVKAINSTSLGEKNDSLNTSTIGRSIQVQRGDNGNTYNYYRNTTSKVETDGNGIRSFTYIKNATLTMYYPEHTTFVGVNNLPNGAIVDQKPAENKVIISIPGPTIENSNVSLTYKVDSNAPYGTIQSQNKNTMEVEYYDGHKETLIADKVDSVQVVDPSTLGSIIEMTVLDGYYHDYNGNSLSIGGYIYLDKATLIEYTNQVFEYNFSNWNTRKVLIPEGITDVVDIKYTLFGDPTVYNLNPNDLADFGGAKRLIDGDKLPIAKDQYFENVTFEVNSIQKDFQHLDKGRHNKYAISFGELKSGESQGSTTVKVYSKDNPNITREITREITRVAKPESIAITAGGTSVTQKSGSSTTTKSYQAKTIFDANRGFTRQNDLSNYLENPEIIIRMPQGFNLSKTSIKLKQNNVETTPTITEHTGSDGATIYTLKTNDVKIGGFDPITLAINPSLNIEFDFDVESYVGGNFNINDMIFIGKKDANIDRYYTSADIVVTTDKFGLIPGENRSLGRCESKPFDIIKTSDLIVTTHVRDNGSDVDKKPYDKNDENTAIQITKDSLIDFIVKIENNTIKATKEVAVYIPIPKKGVYMGPQVQEEEFTWDMELHGIPDITVKDSNGAIIPLADIFEITYGSSQNTNDPYTSTPSPDKDVIKIIAKNDINPGVIGEIKFTFKASDNLPQAYVGSLNVFNAFYTRRYDSGSVVMLQGNSVGMKLAIGQIKGIAFLDNDRNGLYDIVTDTLLKDVEIKLWDKDKGIEVATTKTNSNGEYKFEGLPAGNYEIRVKNDGNPINANETDAKRFTKQTIVSGDSYKYDSDILSTNDIDGSITVSIPNNSMTPDINDYINVGFIEPINVNIITDGNGTVSGGHSLAYKAWAATTIQEPGTITPNTGYRFVKYTNADTDAIFNFPFEVNSDITIKAHFEKIIYTINLDSNGGNDGTKTSIEVAFDELIKTGLNSLTGDELPTRDGYKLVGWATNQDGSGLITDTDRMGTSPITLYAVWEKIEYPITLNANGGIDGNTTSIEVAFEDKIKDALDLLKGDALPTREGHKLVGWATNQDGSGLITDANKMGASPMTLYAVWEKVEYTITLDANGGIDGNTTSIEVAFDNKIKDALDLLKGDALPTKEGHKLVGWATNQDGSGLITDANKMGASPMTLYAVWEKMEYTITLDANGGNAGNTTSIKVPFEDNIKDALDKLQDADKPTREGYTFVGWSRNPQGTANDIITANETMGSSPIELYAVWEKVEYTITLNANGGNAGNTTSIKVPFDESIKDSLNLLTGDELPTRDGYKLVGWATNQDGSGLITDTDRMGAASITLYAVWDKAPEITGADDKAIKVNDIFNELDGVDAIDPEQGSLKGSINVIENTVDVKNPGKYKVVYEVTDRAGNVTTAERIITVYGEPIITGADDKIIQLGSAFEELAGVEAKDTEGNNLKITVTGTIDENKLGPQKITYTVEDAAGNIKTVERTITVYGEPTITGTDDKPIKLGSTFDPLAGVVAKDTEGNNLKVTVTGTIDENVLGPQKITYTVEDAAGNIKTVE
ncbi:InlB B-repeat-containing protein, partial [uncultured Clostridium sp.]|uniref:InlB B-repeat-containing protein n=1 Tax=uncultured Clostridium sp. TaxID=59620 RepID=UPI0025E9C41D